MSRTDTRSARTPAYAAAERARQAIDALTIPGAGRLTLSVAVCDLAHASNSSDLYEHADRALYWAKSHGLNRPFRYSTESAEQLRTSSPSEPGELDSSRLKTLAELTAAADAKHADFTDQIDALRQAALLQHRKDRRARQHHRQSRVAHRPRTSTASHPAAVGAEMLSVALTPAQTSWIRHHHEH